MRIAYTNLLDSALNLTATNVDNDSSVTNLYHPYLEHALNCTETFTTITGAYATAQTVSCLAVAFHTCEELTLTLYGLTGNTLLTQVITLEVNDSVYYLTTAIADVYSFSLAFTGGEQVTIGYIYLGQCHVLSSHSAEPSFPNTVTSTSGQSTGGQTYGDFGRLLRGFSCTFPGLTSAERDLIMAYVQTVQTAKPHIIDIYPESHDIEAPMYCKLNKQKIDIKKGAGGVIYSLSLEWMEAR